MYQSYNYYPLLWSIVYMCSCKIISYQVVRAGGLLGTVNVSWAVLSDSDDDIVEDSGFIIFEPGQGSHEIPIWVRGDKQPELDEVIMVQLMEVSQVNMPFEYCLYE